ncbi:MAG: glutathione S-transferase [bacterium]
MSERRPHAPLRPRTRSATALWLLEELGEPYDLEVVLLASGHHKTPAFLAMNPMGKSRWWWIGRVVPELGAIAIHLADRYPRLAWRPPSTTPSGPDFLRWVFFSSAIFEPALAQKFFGWTPPGEHRRVGLLRRDDPGGHRRRAAGARCWATTLTTADVLVASGLGFGMRFGAIPPRGPLHAYVQRAFERPAYARCQAIEAREGARFPPA